MKLACHLAHPSARVQDWEVLLSTELCLQAPLFTGTVLSPGENPGAGRLPEWLHQHHLQAQKLRLSQHLLVRKRTQG